MEDGTPTWFATFEARLVTRLDSVSTRLSGVDARLDATATLADLNSLRVEIMDRIDRLQETLTTQREDGAVNYNLVATSAGRLVSLEESVIALTRMVRRLQTRLDDLEGRQQGH